MPLFDIRDPATNPQVVKAVYCDGVLLKAVIACDTEAGWALKYQMHPNSNRPVLKQRTVFLAPGESPPDESFFLTELVKGEIVVELGRG